MQRPMILLASASPRRAEILAQVGLPFRRVAMREVREDHPEHDPERLVAHLARLKCAAAILDGEALDGATYVFGADTVVVVEGDILGKPRDASDAADMLRRLSGRVHHVYTGHALAAVIVGEGAPRLAQTRERVARTEVTFAALDDATIAAYLATGEPFDKAGAYGIQGPGALFIEGIAGEYFTVMGLSVRALTALLGEFGWPVDTLLGAG